MFEISFPELVILAIVSAAIGTALATAVTYLMFDGVDAGRYCKPALTTIEQDMAAAAGLLVNSVLAGDALTHAPQGHRSPVKLIVRASTVA